MKQIVTHFTDNDLYTFSVLYYILRTYPRAEVEYTFFDRNNTVYPKGFGDLLREQIDGIANVKLTDAEAAYMMENVYFLPHWFIDFLKGYTFNPKEVEIHQDEEGHLSIKIKGKWYSTIMWEMPILSTISELLHMVKGDIEKVDMDAVYREAYAKGTKAFTNGIVLSDMGTRRRFSFDVQQRVIEGLKDSYERLVTNINPNIDPKDYGIHELGKFVGTSNVWFAKEFGLKCIGTMSHQICSFEECVSGLFECNYNVMKKWSDCYDGDLGIMLPDCWTHEVFFSNFSKKMAKMFDGIRIDSGDEMEETEKFIEKYKSLGIDPATKSIVYSNALTIDKAIELHKWVNGRMKDSYGIGTHLCADVTNMETKEKFPYSNIVIKLTRMRLTELREWHDCVKLSNNITKTLGNKAKCAFLVSQIKENYKQAS